MVTNVELGRHGETLAAKYFEDDGCKILDRNWRCRLGEIDLVVRDQDDLVCVEVKTRRSLRAGHPLEAITPVKLQRMRKVAVEWALANPLQRGRLRLDVLSVELFGSAKPRLMHVVGVGDLG